MQAIKAINQYPYSREHLRELDQETVIDMFLSLDVKFQQLGDYVRDLVNAKYGSKNEHFEGTGQLLIFPDKNAAAADLATVDSSAPGEDNSDSKSKPAEKKKPGHTRNPLPSYLPRVPVLARPPEDSKFPCACGTNRVPVRQILQNSRYQFIPASFYCEDLYSVVYGCPDCDSSKQLVVKFPKQFKTVLPRLGFWLKWLYPETSIIFRSIAKPQSVHAAVFC